MLFYFHIDGRETVFIQSQFYDSEVLFMSRKSIFSFLSICFTLLLIILGLITPAATQRAHAQSSFSYILLSDYKLNLDIGDEYDLLAIPSNGKKPVFKSSDSKVAKVNSYGWITAKKAGSCWITVTAGKAETMCRVTVRPTTLKLSATTKTLYRNNSFYLKAASSTGHPVKWKSNKSSVATVNANGKVTAVKHGTATITATVDGTSRTCTVTVAQPTIKLSHPTLQLNVGDTFTLTADVSSKNAPAWSSSNINVVTVDSRGNIEARQEGKAYIYAKEDGVKVSCIVQVTDK